jgi:hypothetical protein
MYAWPKNREQLSLTSSAAQALYMQLVKKDFFGQTSQQLARGKRQTCVPFFIYQTAHLCNPNAMAEDTETGELLPVATIVAKATETMRDLGYRMRVAELTKNRLASISIKDALGFDFPIAPLVETMCGKGFRIHSETTHTVEYTGYRVTTTCLSIAYNLAWVNDPHTFIEKVWPDASETKPNAGNIVWPSSMGAPVLLPSPVAEWRRRVDAQWPSENEIVAALVV